LSLQCQKLFFRHLVIAHMHLKLAKMPPTTINYCLLRDGS